MRRLGFCAPVIGIGMALALAAIVFGAACSATTGSAAPATPQPFPDDVPYTLTFPEGWTYVTGDGAGWAAYLDEVGNRPRGGRATCLLGRELADPGIRGSQRRAAESIKPFVSCSKADTGGRPASEMLLADEQQTVEGIATAPNITRAPVSDHVSLPVGETVRYRLGWTDDGGTELAAIAYAFVADDMLIVCLFQSSPETVATYEPEWEAIIGTFSRGTQATSPPASSPK